jgi:predicted nucleic acid-binding Zn ribbon protein
MIGSIKRSFSILSIYAKIKLNEESDRKAIIKWVGIIALIAVLVGIALAVSQ